MDSRTTQIHPTQNDSKAFASFICVHMINVNQTISLPLGLHLVHREISEAIKCFSLLKRWSEFLLVT